MAKTTKPKQPGKRGRKSPATQEMWIELRTLYETGDYSQRQLVAYAKARGVNISQTAIQRRISNEGWVKGSRLAEVREDILAEIQKGIGQTFTEFLELQAKKANLLDKEAILHFQRASEIRNKDPDYVIPAVTLRILGNVMDIAAQLKGRAIGFDLYRGKPYKSENVEESELLTKLQIEAFTELEEQQIRERTKDPAEEEEAS